MAEHRFNGLPIPVLAPIGRPIFWFISLVITVPSTLHTAICPFFITELMRIGASWRIPEMTCRPLQKWRLTSHSQSTSRKSRLAFKAFPVLTWRGVARYTTLSLPEPRVYNGKDLATHVLRHAGVFTQVYILAYSPYLCKCTGRCASKFATQRGLFAI